MKLQRLQDAIARYAPHHAPAGTPTGVKLLGRAELPGWTFDLGGHGASNGERVCDIREIGGPGVWGALYEIDSALVIRADDRRSVLDTIEGHRRDKQERDVYRPTCVELLSEASRLHAWTFVCSATARRCPDDRSHRASLGYVKDVLDGAKAVGLPEDYRVLLKRACEAAVAGK
jgi:hypothetical protein